MTSRDSDRVEGAVTGTTATPPTRRQLRERSAALQSENVVVPTFAHTEGPTAARPGVGQVVAEPDRAASGARGHHVGAPSVEIPPQSRRAIRQTRPTRASHAARVETVAEAPQTRLEPVVPVADAHAAPVLPIQTPAQAVPTRRDRRRVQTTTVSPKPTIAPPPQTGAIRALDETGKLAPVRPYDAGESSSQQSLNPGRATRAKPAEPMAPTASQPIVDVADGESKSVVARQAPHLDPPVPTAPVVPALPVPVAPAAPTRRARRAAQRPSQIVDHEAEARSHAQIAAAWSQATRQPRSAAAPADAPPAVPGIDTDAISLAAESWTPPTTMTTAAPGTTVAPSVAAVTSAAPTADPAASRRGLPTPGWQPGVRLGAEPEDAVPFAPIRADAPTLLPTRSVPTRVVPGPSTSSVSETPAPSELAPAVGGFDVVATVAAIAAAQAAQNLPVISAGLGSRPESQLVSKVQPDPVPVPSVDDGLVGEQSPGWGAPRYRETLPTGSVPSVTGSLRAHTDSDSFNVVSPEPRSEDDLDDADEKKTLSLLHVLLLIAIAIVLALLIWKADFEKDTKDSGAPATHSISAVVAAPADPGSIAYSQAA